jgi:hypothetical protein
MKPRVAESLVHKNSDAPGKALLGTLRFFATFVKCKASAVLHIAETLAMGEPS